MRVDTPRLGIFIGSSDRGQNVQMIDDLFPSGFIGHFPNGLQYRFLGSHLVISLLKGVDYPRLIVTVLSSV